MKTGQWYGVGDTYYSVTIERKTISEEMVTSFSMLKIVPSNSGIL